MAPEVLLKKEIGLPADIYGFGLILWEMLSKEKPYSKLDLEEVNMNK